MNIHKSISFIIHILILILLISFFINNKNNNTNLIFILCSTIIYICYLLEFVRKPNIMNIKLNNNNNNNNNNKNNKDKNNKDKNNNIKEYFRSPVDYKMGPYSDIKLSEKNDMKKPKFNKRKKTKCSWRKQPCDVPLFSNVGFTTPTGLDSRYKEDTEHVKTLPSIDGTNKAKKSLFMFANNQCRPECCPSTYTCDKGCVCTTEQQRKFINTRGYNRNSVMYPDI